MRILSTGMSVCQGVLRWMDWHKSLYGKTQGRRGYWDDTCTAPFAHCSLRRRTANGGVRTMEASTIRQTTGNRGTAKLGDYGIESAAREDRCYVSPAAGEFWQSVRKNGHAKSGSYVACKEDYRAPCQTACGRLLPLQYARPAAGYFASDANYAKKGRIL